MIYIGQTIPCVVVVPDVVLGAVVDVVEGPVVVDPVIQQQENNVY